MEEQAYIKPDTKSVFIGICEERVYIPDFEASLDALVANRGDINVIGIHRARGHRVDRNRDKIVKAFFANPSKPDYLLFLDSDMTFPENIIERLVGWNLPIIGGLYFHRKLNFPFVFKEVGKKEDEWGRKIFYHEYMFDEVYDFLNSVDLPRRDLAVAIDAPGRLLHADAIGTGAMLIRRDVLERMDGPWFEYSHGAESEDLTFCRKARGLGFQIHADLGTICGHVRMTAGGYSQFLDAYKARGLQATNYDFHGGINMLAHCLDIPNEEAGELITKYHPRILADHYHKMVDAEAEADNELRDIDFYTSHETGELYIPELIRWNASPTFGYFREQLMSVEGAKVLEIGSGIGSIAIQLAAQECDVDAFEANAELIKFSKRRLEWLEDKEKFMGRKGKIEWHGAFKPGRVLPATPGAYDLVVALDVLEHMDLDTLKKVVEYISMYLKVGGRLFAHAAWGDHTTEGVHPFHYDHSSAWPELLKANGLFKISDLWYVKVGSKIE